jgi:hypothetical protein
MGKEEQKNCNPKFLCPGAFGIGICETRCQVRAGNAVAAATALPWLASSARSSHLRFCPASLWSSAEALPGGGRGVSCLLLPPKPDKPLKKHQQGWDSAGAAG